MGHSEIKTGRVLVRRSKGKKWQEWTASHDRVVGAACMYLYVYANTVRRWTGPFL